MSFDQLSPISQAELETGTTTRPPKLKGAEYFSTWKTRIQSFFEYTDYNLWLSVTTRPHIPTVVRGDAVVASNDATTFTDEDKALIQRDLRAHAALTMALSTDDCNMFEEHRTANALWNALIEYYEGNEECRIVSRPKRVVRKSSNPFQRRKQRNGRVHSLNHTLNLLYIDFTAFTVTRNTGNTSVSDLKIVTNEIN
ncbi:hypothetical protein HanIR_Chr12g0583081 [Helianthus annuus]|nr:hypothetical protein HanIR_Chr12g0583081 [Helianthus annuus]